MKTLEEIFAALVADETYGQVAVDVINARLSKVNGEAQNLRTKKLAAETRLAKIFEVTGITPETEDIEEAFKTLKGKPAESKSEIDKLTKQVQTLQAIADTEKAINRKNSINTGILEELTGNKVLPEWLPTIKDVLGTKVKYNKEDKIVFTSDDGTEVDLKEGVKDYVTKNPKIVSSEQNPGGGTKPPGSNAVNKKTMKMSDYNKLTPYEQREFVITDKGTPVEG